MAFYARFHSFSKRINSTKRPPTTASGGVWATLIELKDSTNLLAPVIALKHTPDEGEKNPLKYNYCFIEELNRYYWISEWTYERGLWIASLDIDVLATWQPEIGESVQYVSRASNARIGRISDNFYPAMCGFTRQSTTFESPFNSELSQGTYVIGLIGGGENAAGVSYVTMTSLEYKTFFNYIFSDDFFEKIGEDPTLKAEINPMQYIAGITWYPFLGLPGELTFDAYLGWWDTNRGMRAVSSGTKWTTSGTFPLVRHALAESRGEYMNCAPWSRYTLYFYPFGIIPINTDATFDNDTVRYTIEVDVINGDALLTLYNGAIKFEEVRAKIGVQISLANIYRDEHQLSYLYENQQYQAAVGELTDMSITAKMVSTAAGDLTKGFLGAVGGAAVGGAGFGAIAGLTGVTQLVANAAELSFKRDINAETMSKNANISVLDIKSAMVPQLRMTGTNGSAAMYSQNPMIVAEYLTPTQADPEHVGYPCNGMYKIGELGGYIKCMHSDFTAPATSTELYLIKNYMETGFFYEIDEVSSQLEEGEMNVSE